MNRNEKGQFIKRTNGKLFEGHKIWHDRKGYACIHLNGRDIKVHILVWERTYGKKPDGYDIHHIDENKNNFSLSNLQLLTHSDHQKVHAGWVKENDRWVAKPCHSCGQILPLIDFYQRTGRTPTAKCKPCHLEDCKNRCKRPEIKQRLSKQRKQKYLAKKGVLCGI